MIFDNWLTRVSAQFGLYSGVGFLTFIATLNPITRAGASLCILSVFTYLLSAIYKSYVAEYRETLDREKAKNFAISEHLVDVCLFFFFIVASWVTATF